MPNLVIRQPKRILIIRLSSLGDITQCLPVSYNLRKNFNQAYIAWLVREKYAKLLEMDASLDEIIEIKNTDSRTIFGRITEIIRIIKIIRSRKFDIVLDLHCALITNIISIWSDTPLRLGIDKKNELKLKILKYSPLPKDKEIHRINAYLSVLNLLGIKNQEISYPLRIPLKNKDKALNLLKEYGYSSKETIIALHPGTSWEIKQWGIEKFAKLSSILSMRYDTELVIIYGPKESFCEQNKIRGLFSTQAKFISCPSIKELTALLEKCDLLIGNDSGPVHLAAALGTPTISIFGPSNHLVSRPYGDKNTVVRKNTACSPCYGRFSVKFKCKNKNRQECLKSLSVGDVLNAADPIITGIINAKQKKNIG